MKSKFYLLLFISLLTVWQANAQCRGTQPGELYFSLAKYYDIANDVYYNMIARTTDYGQTLEPLYNYQSNTTDMPVGWVLADATPGVLYNQLETEIYRSFDNAQTWELASVSTNNSFFATGSVEGEIYKTKNEILYYSCDYGETFNETSPVTGGKIETGTNPGEIYVRKVNTISGFTAEIKISFDYGINFNIYPVDNEIVGLGVSGNRPIISRGVSAGELYLVTWWLPANYKIYRSTDYGENFTLQYEQPDTCFFWDEVYQFTAGREPCEFYILKIKTWIDGYYNRLHIYHSSDCGQSFTEYVHVLDENWTGIDNLAENNNSVLCYPNPTNGIFTIKNLQAFEKPCSVSIADITGKQIYNSHISTFSNFQIDISNQPKGIYFITIQYNSNNETNFQTQKIIKL